MKKYYRTIQFNGIMRCPVKETCPVVCRHVGPHARINSCDEGPNNDCPSCREIIWKVFKTKKGKFIMEEIDLV